MIKIMIFRYVIRMMALFSWRKHKPKNLQVKTISIPVENARPVKNTSIRLRIYTPESQGPFPVILYFHGGGFVIGDLESHDPLCRDLCVRSNHIVIAVDYRLAPEHPFPTAPQDCIAALDWLTKQFDSLNGIANQIFVAGDSAGGNLAAVVALQARDKFPNVIKGQVLIFPITDHYRNETPSYRDKAKGYGLTRAMMIWFWDLYYRDCALLKPGEVEHELATPLTVSDLSGLPPALVITAEHDPLRDEGIAYAERLKQQGVQVQLTLYNGVEHGFIGALGPSAEHDKGIGEIVTWLNTVQQQGDNPT